MKQSIVTVYTTDYSSVREAKRAVEIMESMGYISTSFAGGWILEIPYTGGGMIP